jgi:hypothetical protein
LLCLYTGSRLAEYGQSKVQKGSRFARIPNTQAAGKWKNMPLAFIESDFESFDQAMIPTSNALCIDPKVSATFLEVHIRFWLDKCMSSRFIKMSLLLNFVTRKAKIRVSMVIMFEILFE